jgi:hypothetical protein
LHNGGVHRTLRLAVVMLALGSWACTPSQRTAEMPAEGSSATTTTAVWEARAAESSSTTTTLPPSVTAATLTRRGSHPPYAVDIRYPQLTAGPAPARARLNRQVRVDVERTANEFITSLDGGGLGDPESQSLLDGDFGVVLATDRWLSLSIGYGYTPTNAAHPWETWTTYNYDLRQGRRIALTDLFRPGTGWRQKVTDEARRQVREQFPSFNEMDPTRGRLFTDEELAPFTLRADGLRIDFEEYVLVPRVAGTVSATIPFEVLEPFLRLDWRGAGSA